MNTSPSVSVIVCSRNRPMGAERTVRSLLASVRRDIEVVLIDQSDDTATGDLLFGVHDSRLRYLHVDFCGKGRAMNVGINVSVAPFIAFTDDDCEIPAGWVDGVVSPLETQSTVGLVFSRVDAAEHESAHGYVPALSLSHSRYVQGLVGLWRGWGLGAGMAARRDALCSIGGVDEMLGPGGKFPSADDLDLEIRMLICGWEVYETAEVGVVHHGFRTWEEGRLHTIRDWRGIGGCLAKPIRRGSIGALLLLLAMIGKALTPMIQDIVHFRRPRVRRFTSLLGGLTRGLRTPMDKDHLTYRPR